jgi:hypothetical protein
MNQKENRASLHAALGHKPLNRHWAKLEIWLGLMAAGSGLFLGFWTITRTHGEGDWTFAVAGLSLFVLGSYLAMAGHRSHLYQSNNELTAYLAGEIHRLQDKG